MKISQYIKEYTSGEKVTFRRIFSEINELFAEIISLNKEGMKEETEDVFHFLQLWLFWRFGLDQDIWGITRNSVKKFMDRKEIWKKIYVFVGLDQDISCYVGNYNKVSKVIDHLKKFGICKEKAEASYRKIVLNK